METFQDYFKGKSPDWIPDAEYRVMEDVEAGNGIPVRSGTQAVFALIPFCVYAYLPSAKSTFGVEEVELQEVYPFVSLVYQNGDAVDKRAENAVLPSHIIKDQKRLVDAAFRHIKSEINGFNLLQQPIQQQIKKICWNKAEQDLRDNPGDVELHPHDPDYDHN